MWIKVQNGGRLCELYGDVSVKEQLDGFMILREDRKDKYGLEATILGEYDTKERALEVLDEIQKNIMDSNVTQYEYYNSADGLKVEYTYKLKTVYEMPKE